MFVHQSINLSVHLSVHLSICHLSFCGYSSICLLSIFRSVHLSFCPSVNLSIWHSVNPYIHLPCWSVHLSVHLFLHLSAVCPSICSCVCQFISIPVHLSIHLSVHPSVHLYICLSVHLHIDNICERNKPWSPWWQSSLPRHRPNIELRGSKSSQHPGKQQNSKNS